MAERDLAKVEVAGSSPVIRSRNKRTPRVSVYLYPANSRQSARATALFASSAHCGGMLHTLSVSTQLARSMHPHNFIRHHSQAVRQGSEAETPRWGVYTEAIPPKQGEMKRAPRARISTMRRGGQPAKPLFFPIIHHQNPQLHTAP